MDTTGYLDFKVLERALCDMKSFLVSGYGPSFQHTVVSTSTGRVLITNSGCHILKTMGMNHPIFQYIVSSACSHHANVGDNSKTFVLLLYELVRNSLRVIDSGSPAHCRESMTRLAADFSFALTDILPQLFGSMEKFCSIFPIDNKDSIDTGLRQTVAGLLGCHLLDFDTVHLSGLISSWISQWCFNQSPQSLYNNLSLLSDNHDIVVIENSGKPVKSSYMQSGIFVSRGFCNSDSDSVTALSERELIKFVLLTCPIETVDDTLDPNIELNIPESYQQETISKIITFKRLRTNLFMNRLQQLGVSVIITSCLFSSLEKTQSSRFGITAVHTVPIEEIYFVANTFDMQVVTCTEDLCSQNVGRTESLQQMAIASSLFINIGCQSISQFVKPCSLIAAGPTEGISQQIKSLVKDTLKSIRSALHTPTTRRFTTESLSSESFVKVGTGKKSSRFSDGGDSGISLSPNDQLKRPLDVQTRTSLCNSAENLDYQGQRSESLRSSLLLTPAGGAFELGLHCAISNYLGNQPAGAPGTTALTVLKESLLCVPHLIHTNAYYIAKPRWLSTLKDLEDAFKQGKLLGVNATDGTASGVQTMHPFYSKCLCINDVLCSLMQLMRIDQIL